MNFIEGLFTVVYKGTPGRDAAAEREEKGQMLTKWLVKLPSQEQWFFQSFKWGQTKTDHCFPLAKEQFANSLQPPLKYKDY